jgi:hypothetical protein
MDYDVNARLWYVVRMKRGGWYVSQEQDAEFDTNLGPFDTFEAAAVARMIVTEGT